MPLVISVRRLPSLPVSVRLNSFEAQRSAAH